MSARPIAGTLTPDRLRVIRFAAVAMGAANIADFTLGPLLGVNDHPPALAGAMLSSLRAAATAGGLIALLYSGACGPGRMTWLAQIVAITGSALLVPAELLVHWSRAIAGPFYALGVIALLVGPLWYGTAAIRQGRWTGWRKWTPLLPAVFIAVFVLALFAGRGGALALGVFVLSYVPLAVALFTQPGPGADTSPNSGLAA